MSTQILATKLYKPVLRSDSVLRPRLIERLNMGLHGKLTLATAPAGFGKTTVIAEWSSSEDLRVAWLSLDKGDNDPVRFLIYVIAALRTVEPEFGASILNLLESPQPPPIDSLLTPLLNELAKVPYDFVLVLDDYHVLDNTEIDSVMAFLIDNQSPQMHLVITTREDPFLPLARLRARGSLTELRVADLRFTPDEAAEFLNNAMALSLTPEDVAALEQRTEGWIAGLQLAAISMKGQQDNRQFIESFTGSHHFVLDYLIEEVLSHQPPHIQDFLLKTSILERLCGPLCAAVLQDDEDAQATLESIRQANLFLIPLDNERRWFRYHHLFGDLLRKRLGQSTDIDMNVLHIRASKWYEHHQFKDNAIQHATAGNDYERAANLVEMTWPGFFNGVQPMTLLRWVKALPDDLVRTRPVINLAGAWTLLHEGDLEAADSHLRNIELWLDVSTQKQNNRGFLVVNTEALHTLPALVTNARLYQAQAQGNTALAKKYGEGFLDVADADDHYHRGLASTFLALAYWADGNLETACQYALDAITFMQNAQNGYFECFSNMTLAEIYAIQGHLRKSQSQYEHALQFELDKSQFALKKLSDRHIGLALLHLERNDMEAAKRCLHEARKESVEQAIFPGRVSRWYIVSARIKKAEGDLDGALEQLDAAAHQFKRDVFPNIRPIEAEKVHIWIAQGNLTQATTWAHRQSLSVDHHLSYLREFEYMTLARLRIVQGQTDNALPLLNRLLEEANQGGRIQSVIEILTLQAIAHHAQDNSETALQLLEHALTLAEPEGYVRIFVDEGLPIKHLLTDLYQQELMPDYIATLLGAFDGIPDDSQVPANQALIEPLSERELEILQLVAEGLSNREISERLYLALSTVKGHNGNIYGKLGVSRRTEAVALARELGLIQD